MAAVFVVCFGLAGAGEPAGPPAPKSASVLELPPVSDEALLSLTDYLLAHLTYEGGYSATRDASAIPGAIPGIDDLEHVTVYRKPGVQGVIIVALRPTRTGALLIIKATSEDNKLLKDVNNAVRAARARIGTLKKKALRDILSNAKVVDYRLSYIGADRALGALKVMGYNVVEMKQTDGVGQSKVFSLEGVVDYELPIISMIVDSANTSLVEEKAKPGTMGSVTPSLGGRSLANVTDSSEQQRLLIAYDPDEPDSLRRTLRDIEEVVDVAAQQILIEGMIVEVSEDKLHELGISHDIKDGRLTYSFKGDESKDRPLRIEYSDFAPVLLSRFESKLRVLIERGSAEILSKPSILALNNYQARIRIGREVPISNTVVTFETVKVDVSYFFMGIVLNIKPRISRDQKEVSMQVEAIVSSEAPIGALMAGGYQVAPAIDSRVVQTFARVSNNTPFIIGGLVSHDVRKKVTGIPLLMDIPLLGHLFKTTSRVVVKNEVIVVLTPRIVPQETENYFALIPKDSEKFEFLTDSVLFRNTYRIRGEDKFDLTFVYEDRHYMNVAALAAERVRGQPALADNPAIRSILEKNIPGERALMLRMLYEVVKDVEKKIAARKKLKTDRIPDESIIFFLPHREKEDDLEQIKVSRLLTELDKLKKNPGHALLLHYDLAGTEKDSRLMPPLNVRFLKTTKPSDYDEWMKVFNRMREVEDGSFEFESVAIIIQNPKDLQRLKTCLILKKLLEINNFPEALHVKDFPVGKQILYPNLGDDTGYGERIHVVDAKVAELYYISDFYYQAFQQVYHAELDKIDKILKEERKP